MYVFFKTKADSYQVVKATEMYSMAFDEITKVIKDNKSKDFKTQYRFCKVGERVKRLKEMTVQEFEESGLVGIGLTKDQLNTFFGASIRDNYFKRSDKKLDHHIGHEYITKAGIRYIYLGYGSFTYYNDTIEGHLYMSNYTEIDNIVDAIKNFDHMCVTASENKRKFSETTGLKFNMEPGIYSGEREYRGTNYVNKLVNS